MSADSAAIEVNLSPITEATLAAVQAIEQQAHPHPWQLQHFRDCLQAGYLAQCLHASDTLLGYFVAMRGVDEVHLLNLTVAPQWQRQGWAQWMLRALLLWSRGLGAQCVWLEVRASNTRAIHVYKAHGFRYAGRRKQYYPAGAGQREDAWVMSCPVQLP